MWAEARGAAVTDEDRALARKARDHVRDVVEQAGLWAPHLPPEYGGAGLDFLELAYMYEVLAYATGAAALFGIVAPNSGNQRLLLEYGTEEQKARWLVPLVEGTMQSGFSMTEPDAAGSDPRSLRTTARRDGDEWVIDGRKVWGRPSDHCEIVYDGVRVPLDNALGERGSGHRAAQDRLGAGRVYHCMNSVGARWRAFDLMVERATQREVHGGLLETKQLVQQMIADSYLDVQSARLMTIDCAEKLAAGQDARTDISAIKVFVPAAFHRVVDRAIQVWGAAGVTAGRP